MLLWGVAIVFVIVFLICLNSKEVEGLHRRHKHHRSHFTGESDGGEKSLYDRLGGIYAIAAVVDHFSDSLINNPVVGVNSKNPFLREWNRHKLDRLPGLKFMRTLWLSDVAGGPFTFHSSVGSKDKLNLEKAHCPLKVTSEEFDEVAKELAKSLAHFNVPEKETNEVLTAFAAHKHEVIFCSK